METVLYFMQLYYKKIQIEDMVICRCEEVTLKDIQDTFQTHKCSAREVKLRTRAGMGYCGGRTCRPAVDAVLEEVTGEEPGNDIPLKVQPPVRPTSLETLGIGADHE